MVLQCISRNSHFSRSGFTGLTSLRMPFTPLEGSCWFSFLVGVLEVLLFLPRFVSHPSLPCSETRAYSAFPCPVVPSWMRIRGDTSGLENEDCIPLLQRPQRLLGGQCPELKRLSHFLVTALPSAGSWKYYQNDLFIKQSWVFVFHKKTRHHLGRVLAVTCRRREIKVRSYMRFWRSGLRWIPQHEDLVWTGQNWRYNTLRLVDTARWGFLGELKRKKPGNEGQIPLWSHPQMEHNQQKKKASKI